MDSSLSVSSIFINTLDIEMAKNPKAYVPPAPAALLPVGVADQIPEEKGLTACLLFKPKVNKMDSIFGLKHLKDQVHEVFSGEPTAIESLFSTARRPSNSFLFYGVRVNSNYFKPANY